MLYPVELRAHTAGRPRRGVRRRGAHPNETGPAMQAAKRPENMPPKHRSGRPGNAYLTVLQSRIEDHGRRMTFMAFRLFALLGLLLGLAIPAHAQDISSADRAAIRDIIQSQVEAFRRDDGDSAFGYASPSIRNMFGTSEI